MRSLLFAIGLFGSSAFAGWTMGHYTLSGRAFAAPAQLVMPGEAARHALEAGE